jgi:hypothetical protein
MGVNCPSVKSPRPNHGWGKFVPHAILQRKGKRGGVVKGRKKPRATAITEENWKKSGNTGSSEPRRRRVTFVLDYFSVSGEGE